MIQLDVVNEGRLVINHRAGVYRLVYDGRHYLINMIDDWTYNFYVELESYDHEGCVECHYENGYTVSPEYHGLAEFYRATAEEKVIMNEFLITINAFKASEKSLSL